MGYVVFWRTVSRILSEPINGWSRISTWTTHAYMVNLNKKELIEDINKAYDYDDEIDKYYIEKVYTKKINVIC